MRKRIWLQAINKGGSLGMSCLSSLGLHLQIANLVTTTNEGGPQLLTPRRRPGPVVVLLAQTDILLESMLRELDGAFTHRDVRHR